MQSGKHECACMLWGTSDYLKSRLSQKIQKKIEHLQDLIQFSFPSGYKGAVYGRG